MSLFEFSKDEIIQLTKTTFNEAGLRERQDLQRLLRDNIKVISPDTLVIAEEFSDWVDTERRIDLLGIDKKANLVVIELKRTEGGGHMDLQAIRYASMVSNMTFEKAVETFEAYLEKLNKKDQNPRSEILNFLGWKEEEAKDDFAKNVRIVLASGGFDPEITTTAMWLREYKIDIQCVKLEPYKFEGRILVDIQTIIPLKDTQDYQVQIGKKVVEERETRSGKDYTRYDVKFQDESKNRLPKSRTMLWLCQRLCAHGVDPVEFAMAINREYDKTWYVVKGNANTPESTDRAISESSSSNSFFDQGRWFCSDDELIEKGGKTYALTNQWGNPSWQTQMEGLMENYGNKFRIEFRPTSESE